MNYRYIDIPFISPQMNYEIEKERENFEKEHPGKTIFVNVLFKGESRVIASQIVNQITSSNRKIIATINDFYKRDVIQDKYGTFYVQKINTLQLNETEIFLDEKVPYPLMKRVTSLIKDENIQTEEEKTLFFIKKINEAGFFAGAKKYSDEGPAPVIKFVA